MKKRTILGLYLSIFSLILFSCGIADSSRGNASFTLDTAKIAQRSIQSANFSEVSEEEIFLKYAEYVYFDLSAIVHYEIDGKATDQTFDLWSMNGKEAYELVEKLQNMSGEDEEAYFVEKFSSKTLTITDLPIGKDATFRLKIHQKVGFNIDLSEYGLSESETTKEEYLAISKKPVTARIGEDTDIKIVIGEYDSSLDWEKTDEEDEITGLPWTFTANISENDKDSFNMEFGIIYFFNKTNGKWNLLSSACINVDDNALTIAGEDKIKGSGAISSAIEGNGIASCLSAGDTVLMTMMIFTQPADENGGYTNENLFVGWSDEITIGEDTNKFEFGELSYKEEFHTPLPEAEVYARLESGKDIISTAYAKIDISKVDDTGATTEILTQEFQFTPKEVTGSSNYNGIYYFDSSAFSGLEDGEKISAKLTLYSDESMSEILCTCVTDATFLKKTENIFWVFYLLSGDSGEGDTTSSGKAGTYWDNSNGLPEPVLFVNYNGTEYKSTDSANTLTVTADGESITFANKYLGNDNEWHYYAGMIFDCEYDDTAIPTDAVKWYLNDSQIFQAQVDGTITLTIGETDYNNGGTGVGAAELKTGENTIKVEATYNGNTKSTTMTFIVQGQ